MRIYEDSLKIKQFLMTSYPLKMTSYHSQILLIPRFWVDLFEKTVVVGIQPTSCLLNFHTCTLLFDFKLEKLLQFKRKSINQTLFSTKSTTLNSMVKSDLVIYKGVTMPNLFLQATFADKITSIIWEIKRGHTTNTGNRCWNSTVKCWISPLILFKLITKSDEIVTF